MEMRGMMGGFYRISEWIMRFSVTNVLWVICSSPFFLLALGILTVDTNELMEFLVLLIPLAVVAPFTLFPATTAMFSVVRKWITGDTDVPLLKGFFRGYKENYKYSMLGGLLYVLILTILVFNCYFYNTLSGLIQVLSMLFIIFMVVTFVAILHFFSISVHFHMKLFAMIKNSYLITIGRPFISILMLVSIGGIGYISTRPQFTFLILFFMGSLMAYVSYFYFNRIYQKTQEMIERDQRKAEEEESAKAAKVNLLKKPDDRAGRLT